MELDNQQRGINLINSCLEAENVDGDHEITAYINIRHPNFSTKTVDEYVMNMDSVKVLFFLHDDNDNSNDRCDGCHDTWTVFRFDRGFGIAHYHHWYGPTFAGCNYSIDISPSMDWKSFDKTCLTDDLRDIMSDLMIEMILLGGEDV